MAPAPHHRDLPTASCPGWSHAFVYNSLRCSRQRHRLDFWRFYVQTEWVLEESKPPLWQRPFSLHWIWSVFGNCSCNSQYAKSPSKNSAPNLYDNVAHLFVFGITECRICLSDTEKFNDRHTFPGLLPLQLWCTRKQLGFGQQCLSSFVFFLISGYHELLLHSTSNCSVQQPEKWSKKRSHSNITACHTCVLLLLAAI